MLIAHWIGTIIRGEERKRKSSLFVGWKKKKKKRKAISECGERNVISEKRGEYCTCTDY
jgi:hypothetical protein